MSLQDINESAEYLPTQEDLEAYAQAQIVSTVKINTGQTVMAHEDGKAVKYTNRTQAEKAINRLGVRAKVYQSPTSRVFFVEIVK